MLVIHVDDTLQSGNDEYMEITKNVREQFKYKPREFLPFIFAAVINKDPLGYFLEQTKYSEQIKNYQMNVISIYSYRLIIVSPG